MFDNLIMGLKPLNRLYSTNPFTKVNGNLYINLNFVGYLLPSALADGFYKFLLNTALATFLFISVKRLIQKDRIVQHDVGQTVLSKIPWVHHILASLNLKMNFKKQ